MNLLEQEPQPALQEYPKKKSAKQRSTYYKRKYGIAMLHYVKILNQQKKSCAICGVQADETGMIIGQREFLSVDHCHRSGRVRGLLCQPCNKGLGMFRDDVERLKDAVTYLLSDGPYGMPKLPHRLK